MLTQQRCKEPSAYSGRQQHLFSHWYDTDGERTVKTSGENEAIYVNSEFSGGNTGTARFSLYVSPYLVAGQGGKYTKHIYIGSQRIVSKLGDLASYGADPRRIPYAGNEADGLTINYKDKYAKQLQSIKDNYKAFDQPYNDKDNDDYVNGQGFCCNDGTPEAAQARAMNASTRAAVDNNFHDKDNYEKMQFYYHPDHLGSSSYITNLDGEVSQHIEYVPFGEVFIEERNNTWNTPYLFNAKEFDEKTGMYYYGARYYEPRLSLWMSADPLEEDYPNLSAYGYCHNNPIILYDPDGKGDYFTNSGIYLGYDKINDGKAYSVTGNFNMNDYLNGKIDKKTSISEINLNSNIGQLARIGYAEFRGGNSTEQLVGMDIVMNRVESDKFPNTIEGVITQPWQFSSLNKNDNNRIFYTNPSETLKIQSGKYKGELDKLNHNAWVRSLSNAIKVYKGSERGISKSALLYYSPRSMSRDKNGNPTIPKWDFNKLKEIYVAGVRASYIKMYTYKESKKKGQRK